MKFDIISIFPEFFTSPLSCGIMRIAREKELVHIAITNPRDFAKDEVVDDYLFGGGAGMVLKPEPLFKAISQVHTPDSTIINLTPKGTPLSQAMVKELSQQQHIILVCGRYKGVDERIQQLLKTREVSVGDYVLSGGEIAALAVIESITRLLPGALGNKDSADTDSLQNNLLESPIYTRPHRYRRFKVPPVLRSGNHKMISQWRRRTSLEKTLQERPDLLPKATYSKNDLALLLEVLNG